MSERPKLFLEFSSLDELQAQVEANLNKGRAYVVGEYPLEPRQECDLILVHPESGEWLSLKSEAVYLAQGEAPGVGVEITGEQSGLTLRLSEFVSSAGPLELESSIPPPQRSRLPSIDLEAPESEQVAAPRASDPRSSRSPLPLSSSVSRESQTDVDSEFPLPLSESQAPAPAPSSRTRGDRQLVQARSPAEKVRALNAAGRDRIARRGALKERVALERAYGPAVWESLLSNPLLSTAEVARIAKNRTVAQPILSTIVANSAWLAKGEVRRALLSNPRLMESQIERTLRALPLSELKLTLKQSAYPVRVRNIAKRLLGV